jgi:hypothetical protein
MVRLDLTIFRRRISIDGCLILQEALQVEVKNQNHCKGGLINENQFMGNYFEPSF